MHPKKVLALFGLYWLLSWLLESESEPDDTARTPVETEALQILPSAVPIPAQLPAPVPVPQVAALVPRGKSIRVHFQGKKLYVARRTDFGANALDNNMNPTQLLPIHQASSAVELEVVPTATACQPVIVVLLLIVFFYFGFRRRARPR